MAVALYRVTITGQLLIESIDQIRQNLQDTFDLPEQQLNALLAGKPLVIKANIDSQQAMQFKKALTAAGLETLAEPMSEDSLISAQSLESAADTKPQAQASAFKMAPVGSRIGPRPATNFPPIPTTDHLSADFSERLAPASEPGPKPPNVDHIQLKEPGARLGEPQEDQKLDIDISHLSCDQPDKE